MKKFDGGLREAIASGRLVLERPLCVLDLETTGVVFGQDRIIQFGVTVYYPDKEPAAFKTYIDPEMAIPPEATQKNKITQADVTGAPTFRSMAPALARRMRRMDFLGYNGIRFDLPFLRAEFRREGEDWDWEADGASVIDAQVIYFIKNPRQLEDAYKEYVDDEGFDGAHDAGNDVAATADVLAGQLARHADLPRDVKGLADFCARRDPSWVDKAGKVVWRGQDACLGFGAHRGKTLHSMANDRAPRGGRSYLEWAASDKADFPFDTKKVLRDALGGTFPRKVGGERVDSALPAAADPF